MPFESKYVYLYTAHRSRARTRSSASQGYEARGHGPKTLQRYDSLTLGSRLHTVSNQAFLWLLACLLLSLPRCTGASSTVPPVVIQEMLALELGGAFLVSAAVSAWARGGTSNPRLFRLQQAAAAGHNDVVTEVVEAGLLVDAAAEDGRTALIIAAAADQAATVRILLSMGASPRARIHGDGLTAAHIAAARNGVRVLTCLLDADARLGNVSDSAGLTPLHHACANGHAEAADVLLVTFGFAVDVQAASADGATPLILGASCGSQPCVKILLEHGAQVEAADKAGETALHRACAAGHLPVAALLLDAGASMLRENRRGETAADLAAAAGAEPLARLLQQHHAHRLAAGQREANVAQLVSQRLFDWACH